MRRSADGSTSSWEDVLGDGRVVRRAERLGRNRRAGRHERLDVETAERVAETLQERGLILVARAEADDHERSPRHAARPDAAVTARAQWTHVDDVRRDLLHLVEGAVGGDQDRPVAIR
jgi:hypothetical protein